MPRRQHPGRRRRRDHVPVPGRIVCEYLWLPGILRSSGAERPGVLPGYRRVVLPWADLLRNAMLRRRKFLLALRMRPAGYRRLRKLLVPSRSNLHDGKQVHAAGQYRLQEWNDLLARVCVFAWLWLHTAEHGRLRRRDTLSVGQQVLCRQETLHGAGCDRLRQPFLFGWTEMRQWKYLSRARCGGLWRWKVLYGR